MNASEIAAWWGAGTATMVLVWDIFKWRKSQSSLVVRARSNMQIAGESPKNYIFVEAINYGGRVTEITHLAFYHYESFIKRLFRKRIGCGLVPKPGGQGLPFELEPGKRWNGLVDQSGVVEDFPGGIIYCAVVHTASKKEVLCRVKF